MEIEMDSDLEWRVMGAVKAWEARGEPPLLRALELARCFCCGSSDDADGADLASVLVSNLCFSHNRPAMWKLLDDAMASNLLCPCHVLALLTPLLIPHRRQQLQAFRLYLHLMRTYAPAFTIAPHDNTNKMTKKKITESMHRSCASSSPSPSSSFGPTLVLFLLHAITALIDASLQDWGMPFITHTSDTQSFTALEEEDPDTTEDSKIEQLRRSNSFTALEVVHSITSNQRIAGLLRLAHLNTPHLFNALIQRLHHLSSIQGPPPIQGHLLQDLFSNVHRATHSLYTPNKHNLLGHMIHSTSPASSSWISIDILLESCMEGKTLMPMAAFELLTDVTMTLRIINQGKEPIEGPIPNNLDTRLCMLLAIIPLSIASILKEESDQMHTQGTAVASRKQGLVASLQSLGQFTTLLSPPPSVTTAANQAASKAAKFVTDFKAGSATLGTPTKAVGNLLHLMVEACIARELIDTSAYFWPGYVSPCLATKDQNSMLIQESPWSNFMQGAPLTGSLQSALIETPAPSLAELEKLNHLALNGSEEERSTASKILCGASLTRGWNIQENVVRMVVKLLSPPIPPDSPGTGDANHYLTHMHMLNAVLSCLCLVDSVHILSLYGMVPEVAAILTTV